MYKATNQNKIIRVADNASIPMDLQNRDYQAYLQWTQSGNTPQPADAAPTVPDVDGFILAVKAGLGGIVAANALAAKYPLFTLSLRTSEWDDVQALVIDAKNTSAITLEQYNAIKAAAIVANIPITL